MNCPICVSNEALTYAHWPDFAVQQCRHCGFRFIDTSVQNYPHDAQFAHDESEFVLIRPDQPHIQRRIRDVLRFRDPPGVALDIGCGKGEVALALRARGFECVGIDIKPNIISHLRTHYPQVTWRCALVDELLSMSLRFDVLTMYHVLEHISDPRATLAKVRSLANPGALIVIEVPHVNGLAAWLKGTDWHYYKIDHVNYFRTADLRRLALELDMTILGVRGYQHFSYPQDIFWKDLVKRGLAWLGFQDVISIFLHVK